MKPNQSFSIELPIKNTLKQFYLLIIFIVLSNNKTFAQGNLPFDPRGCGLNCTANDVDVTAAQLYSDAAGTTKLSGVCTPGTNVTAYLGITFKNNSNANRGVIALAADVYFNGAFSSVLKYCPSLSLSGSQTKVFIIPTAITWVCGESIELRNILGGWDTGNAPYPCPTTCSGIIASKCDGTVGNITVTTPPTALFTPTCASAPSLRTMVFTNNSTGGPATGLSYVWNFGDGSPTVTTVSPTHTFPGVGPYNVSLTTTNSVGSDTETIAVNLTPCSIQPVKLISFEGRSSLFGNEITWKTSSQENFSHFEIERSNDAKAFENISKIEGTPNSAELNKYSFTDRNSQKIFSNYYRLKMMDLDGKYEYSKVIFIRNTESEITIGEFYPNPSTENEALIIINTNESKLWTITSFNILGEMLTTENKLINPGENKINVNLKSNYKGLIIFKFENGSNIQYRKMLR